MRSTRQVRSRDEIETIIRKGQEIYKEREAKDIKDVLDLTQPKEKPDLALPSAIMFFLLGFFLGMTVVYLFFSVAFL